MARTPLAAFFNRPLMKNYACLPSAEKLVKTCTKLYTLPQVYLEVKKVIDDPEATMAELSHAVSIDPAMTATVLKLVNSAFYGMPRKVETISRAVGILGMQAVHDLTLAVSVAKTFSRIHQHVMNMKIFWANSFFSGLVARELARKCFLVDSERMFVEGLLRDIGHLILYDQLPEESEQALRQSAKTGTPLHLVEQRLLGFDFTEVGRILVDTWQLPKNLGVAIRYQHNPGATEDHGFEAALLNMANALTEGFQSPNGYMDWQALVTPESWTLTGLNQEMLQECMLEAGKQLTSLLELMDEAQE
jgi:HD-like signal output (HDOD) protein